MKKLLFILSLIISGCYLSNGSPKSYTFWIKDGKYISYEEMKFCFEQSKSMLERKDRLRLEYLESRYEKLGYSKDGFSIMRSEYPNEYQEYIELGELVPSGSRCYYELGYRFKPSIYWCLAQDGNNTKICMENMKYGY